MTINYDCFYKKKQYPSTITFQSLCYNGFLLFPAHLGLVDIGEPTTGDQRLEHDFVSVEMPDLVLCHICPAVQIQLTLSVLNIDVYLYSQLLSFSNKYLRTNMNVLDLIL